MYLNMWQTFYKEIYKSLKEVHVDIHGLIQKIRAVSNIGQRGYFSSKKRAPKNSPPPIQSLFCNFHKKGQHRIAGHIKGLD